MKLEHHKLVFKEDDTFQPIKLEFCESSGPVSPSYQYIIRIKIQSINQEIHFHYKNVGNSNINRKNVQENRILSAQEYIDFMTELLQNNVFQLNRDFIGAERRKKIGISFNFFELILGKEAVKFDYLLQDKKLPEFGNYARIINILQKLYINEKPQT